MRATNLSFSQVFRLSVEENFYFLEIRKKLDESTSNEGRIKQIFDNLMEKGSIKKNIVSVADKNNEGSICQICTELFERGYSFECGHLFCLNYLKTYIETLMETKGAHVVLNTCPFEGCKVKKIIRSF
jgi:hypothetical protein